MFSCADVKVFVGSLLGSSTSCHFTLVDPGPNIDCRDILVSLASIVIISVFGSDASCHVPAIGLAAEKDWEFACRRIEC